MTNMTDIVEGCRSYSNESWVLLLKGLITEMALSPRRSYTLPAVQFLTTLHIQNKTTSDAGIEKWGFSELLDRLNKFPGKNILCIEEFNVETFAVRCVFDTVNSKLLGCTIVKKRNKVMQTPPAWDGSLEALKRFNNPSEK